MPSEARQMVTAQTEKPVHYTYLKEFRVEQCPLFLQHKCTQHRPFTCFHWHFMNQRRRRPVRRRDGAFNYSPDIYCTKFDETTGMCPEGDDCSFLHRTAGDTERRYHLRYYKTCMCVHDTDSRGYCVKNGPHCAFAHGAHDLRPPVYDTREQQVLETTEIPECLSSSTNGPNVLDKERNLMNEDPKWQDTNYVLANYKTDLCKKPPRLCRQGYACPQYHNSKDKRRSPKKYKYRSTPCPNVKHGDEWGDPVNCECGDACQYCHTRTEQQFHPEIYKSTKCNDVQQTRYCPRGVFCAFAHLEQEMILARDGAAPLECGTINLVDIVSSVLPPDRKHSCDFKDNVLDEYFASQNFQRQFLGAKSECESSDKSKRTTNIFQSQNSSLPSSFSSSVSALATPFYPTSETVNSVVGSALEELCMNEPLNISMSLEKEYILDKDSESVRNSLASSLSSSGMLGSSAPVNIPVGNSLSERLLNQRSFSPPTTLQQMSGFLSSFNRHDSVNNSNVGDSFLHQSSSNNASIKVGSFPSSGFFDFSSHQNMSPTLMMGGSTNTSMNTTTVNLAELNRLKQELSLSLSKLSQWEEAERQSRTAAEMWKREGEETNRKLKVTEQENKEVLSRYKLLQRENDDLQGGPFIHALRRTSELKYLSLPVLKTLESQLQSDIKEITNIIDIQTGSQCLTCDEQRSVVVLPCNHYVLCDSCATTNKDCPYCGSTITSKSSIVMTL